MCFMAFEDQDEVTSNIDDDVIEYEESLKHINKLDKKNTSFKKKVFELQKKLGEIKEIQKLKLQKFLLRR